MKDALEYINTNYTPLYKKLGSVPMEGKIGLNFPRILGPWDSFGKHPKLKMLPENVKESLTMLWGQQNKVFKYKPSSHF